MVLTLKEWIEMMVDNSWDASDIVDEELRFISTPIGCTVADKYIKLSETTLELFSMWKEIKQWTQ